MPARAVAALLVLLAPLAPDTANAVAVRRWVWSEPVHARGCAATAARVELRADGTGTLHAVARALGPHPALAAWWSVEGLPDTGAALWRTAPRRGPRLERAPRPLAFDLEFAFPATHHRRTTRLRLHLRCAPPPQPRPAPP